MPRRLKRFLVISIFPPLVRREDAEREQKEILSLIDTYGGADVVKVIQRKDRPDSGTYIGKGKATEVAHLVSEEKIDVVVVNGILKPMQLFALTKLFWPYNPNIEVWDRLELILNIFSRHATSSEAKLQIELAKMRHMGPRIYGLGMEMSQQGGGIGTRGIGETNTELMKRHWSREMKKVEVKLQKVREDRERQLSRRKEYGVKSVAIVGYTNAGKTTLFNRLTKKHKLAKDALFATLDSTTGRLYLPSILSTIVVSDTIGFIQNLPPRLIDAFKSTLMESVYADLLLHVIDINDEKMHEKIDTVEHILRELGLGNKERIYVFNKIDMNVDQSRFEEIIDMYHNYNPRYVSAETGEGIDALVQTIDSFFGKR